MKTSFIKTDISMSQKKKKVLTNFDSTRERWPGFLASFLEGSGDTSFNFIYSQQLKHKQMLMGGEIQPRVAETVISSRDNSTEPACM